MSKESSNHFDESLASEEEDLIQEAIAQGKKINPKKVIFIIRDPNGRIVWLEEGETEEEVKDKSKKPAGLKHILGRHALSFQDLGVERQDIPRFLKNLIQRGVIIRSRNGGVVYRNPSGAEKTPIEIVIGDNGYIVTAFPLRERKNRR